MKRLGLFGLLLTAGAAAQIPDVRFRGDVTATLLGRPTGSSTFRLYSPLGRYSTVGLSAYLENGLVATVVERLQLFAGDADDELLDEYTVEDPGIWRIGKQYLPFGSGLLLRESVRAARADTNLVLEGVPFTGAVFDGGRGRPRGFMARVGPRSYGASIEVGEHIGVSGSALAIVRGPDGSPGRRGGWRKAVGVDASYRVGHSLFRAEVIALREGQGGERNRSLFDLSFTRDLRRRDFVSGEVIVDPDRQQTFLRFSANFGNGRGAFFEPVVILRGGGFDRLGAGLRYRF